MINHFSLTDNPQEIQFNGKTIPFVRELGVTPAEFIKQANALLDKHKIEFPSNFSAEVKENRYTLKSGIQYPTPIENFEGGEARANHSRKLPPFLINCIRLENEFNIDTSRFLKELIKKPRIEGLLHNGSLLVVALFYVERGYSIELPCPSSKKKSPDLLIEGIKCDVKYIRETDFLGRIRKAGSNKVNFSNNPIRVTEDWSVGNDMCFDIGTFIREKCPNGIKQAEMLFADFSEKNLRDLKGRKYSKPEFLPAPRACRIVFFSWSIYTNSIENAYFMDFSKQLWNDIKICATKYRAGAGFLTLPPKDI